MIADRQSNAQVALMAAAEITDAGVNSDRRTLEKAKKFLEWLEANS